LCINGKFIMKRRCIRCGMDYMGHANVWIENKKIIGGGEFVFMCKNCAEKHKKKQKQEKTNNEI